MFATILSLDDWQGGADAGFETPEPTDHEIAEAINKLDGKRHTIVGLRGSGSAYLLIGGGADGRFVTTATLSGAEFFSVLDRSRPEGTLPLLVGGQETDYEERFLVDRSTAIAVAIIFAQRGELDSRYEWVRS